ncbi:MAG TPA: FkbM family methyltransferase [Candidatus Omnitrophota bacterium]|nr:FkbM family methyltransferase [Candidatus Omnitrophota bacterium]
MKFIDAALDRFIPSLQRIHPIGSWKTCYQSLPLSWDQKRRIKRFRKSSRAFTALWHESILLSIQPGEEVSECVYTQGFYEPNQFFAMRQILKNAGTVVDIGAHIGLYTLFASKCIGPAGHIYSFEPSPRERARLEKHTHLNHLSNITVYPLALSDCRAQTEMKVAEYPHSGHNTLGTFAYETTRENSRPLIETQTLDEWAESNRIKAIDLIKIDAEGSEEKILHGARQTLLKTRPILMIEITSLSLNHQNSSVESIWKLITHLGYILMAYDPVSGRPYAVSQHPGIDHTDFIAVPSEKMNTIGFDK